MELKKFWWIGEDENGDMIDGEFMAINESWAWAGIRKELEGTDQIVLYVYDRDPFAGEEK